MKIVRSEYEGAPIKVYKAYYRDKFFVVSKKKDPIVSYMEFHRGLDPDEYRIKKETILDTSYYNNYENSRLVPFYGYFLPQLDISYIEEDSISVMKTFQNTVNQMTYMLYLFHHTKGMAEIHDTGTSYLRDVLAVTHDDRLMKKLEKSHALSHPIIIMGMEEYLEVMKGYQDLKRQDTEIREICREGISF